MKGKLEHGYESEGMVTEDIGAVVFLIVGVGIATLVLIFVGVLGGQVYEQTEDKIDLLSGAVQNQNFTALNGTAVSIHDDIVNGTLSVINATSRASIALTNFIVDYDVGTIKLINNTFNNTLMSANYTWGDPTILGHIRNGIMAGFEALETTGSYLPIVVLAVIIFVVLSIVMGLGAFGGQNQQMQSGAL